MVVLPLIDEYHDPSGGVLAVENGPEGLLGIVGILSYVGFIEQREQVNIVKEALAAHVKAVYCGKIIFSAEVFNDRTPSGIQRFRFDADGGGKDQICG